MRDRALNRLFVLLASALAIVFAGPAEAQLFRSYVSSTGNDANPCTLQQPCRLLPRALATVANGGEIWMLDSANYNVGGVVINKSVTILAIPGALGSVVGNAGDAIAISAPVDVTLRNLNVVFLSGTGSGITVSETAAGARVLVEKCEIYGFNFGENSNGIFVDAAAQLTVIESTVRNNFNGIYLDRGATAVISRSHVLNNTEEGIVADPSFDSVVTAHIVDTVSSGNRWGFSADGYSSLRVGRVFAIRTVATNNITSGYDVWGAFGELYVASSVAAGNLAGFDDFTGAGGPGGIVFTAGNNLVTSNALDVRGSVTPIPLQ